MQNDLFLTHAFAHILECLGWEVLFLKAWRFENTCYPLFTCGLFSMGNDFSGFWLVNIVKKYNNILSIKK